MHRLRGHHRHPRKASAGCQRRRFTRGQTLLGELGRADSTSIGADRSGDLRGDAGAGGATAKLEDGGRTADSRLVELVRDAALAGLGGLSEELLLRLFSSLGRQPDLSALGHTLGGLLRLADSEQQVLAQSAAAPVIDAAFQRCVWLASRSR